MFVQYKADIIIELIWFFYDRAEKLLFGIKQQSLAQIWDMWHLSFGVMPLNYEQSDVFIGSWALNQVLWLRLISNLYLALDKREGHWLLLNVQDEDKFYNI